MPPRDRDQPDLSRLPSAHRKLVVELSHLRNLTGLALRPFGDRAGMAFTRVRRIEQGEPLPSVPEVRAWLAACGVDDPGEVDRIVELARTAHIHTSPWAGELADGHLNHVAGTWEEQSGLICSYQTAIMPGLAQTQAYARALVPHLRTDATFVPENHLAALTRRQDVLHSERRFRFILSQRAWTWSPDPALDLMAAQHDRLRRIDELPGVEVRVLADNAAPMGGYSSFTVYDDPGPDRSLLVVLEIEGGKTKARGADAEHYRARFEQMWDAAHALEAG